MSIIPPSEHALKVPAMYRVRQLFDTDEITDIGQALRDELHRAEIRALVRPGMRVALLCGSRGIHQIAEIVKTVVSILREWGAQPFIVPAMGSHGNANAAGQQEVLAGYGITEEAVRAPIVSHMEVQELGASPSGLNVCVDRAAYEADLIIPIGRVKPHTDFSGHIESGLCKMLTIGLGNHEGCSRLHRFGFEAFASLIPEAAAHVIAHARVGFGVAIVENAYEKTYLVRAVPASRILEEEPGLLKTARALMPSIQFKEIDLLVIDEIGKNISGAGMDPNITGRTAKRPLANFQGPRIQRILVQGLSPDSHGNACGIGAADFMLASMYGRIDLQATYINCVTSGTPESGQIPIQVKDLDEGILAGLSSCAGINQSAPRVVRIPNTLKLGDILVSEALLEEARLHPRMEILDDSPV